MASVPTRLQLFAILLAISFVNGAQGETASVVVGLAKCSDCATKNMNAEVAFKGLHVAVKCKNSHGEYESKAVGQLDNSGAFSIPLTADLLSEDGELKQECFAQLHSEASGPCPGQEPSKIVPQSKQDGKNTFVAVAGEVHYFSPACASAFICHFFHKKHHFFHKPTVVPPFHKKPEPEHKPPEPEHKPPEPEHKPPEPEHKPPEPEHKPPEPEHKPPEPKPEDKPPKPTPIYHPPIHHN